MNKTIGLVIAMLISFISMNAQDLSSKEEKVLSLGESTNLERGLYVQFDKFVINKMTGKIVAIEERDTMYSEATLEPYITSRHWSRDPLAFKYPEWSPYSSFQNNPILYIDPDGAEVFISILATSASRNGHASISVNTYREIQLSVPNEAGEMEMQTFFLRNPQALKFDLSNSSPNNDMTSESFAKTKGLSDGAFQVSSAGKGRVINGQQVWTADEISTDRAVEAKLRQMYDDKKPYNLASNNCADACVNALDGTVFSSTSGMGKESLSVSIGVLSKTFDVTTPNQLYNDLYTLSKDKSSNVIKLKGSAAFSYDTQDFVNKKVEKASAQEVLDIISE